MKTEIQIITSDRNLRRNLSKLDLLRLNFLKDLNSSGTREEYRRNLGEFLVYLRSEFTINELSVGREHITAFKDYLILNKKNCKVTVNKKIAVISSYFVFLINSRILLDNPCFYVRRFNSSNIGRTRALDRSTVETLYRSLPQLTFEQLKKKTMIILLFETGIRESELLGLRLNSIQYDFGSYVLFFEQKGGKFHKVRLKELAVSYLGKYIEEFLKHKTEHKEDSLLFSTKSNLRISRKNFCRMLICIGKKYGIDSNLNPHMARATYIRQSHKEGRDIYSIKKDVGHSSVTTTERYLG